MRALLIATGYLPYTFSECLCNAKLVYALQENGWEVDVISRVSRGFSYSVEWQEPWLCLQPNVYEVSYPMGNKFIRTWDLLRSTLQMGGYPLDGIRWARRAYQKAVELHKVKHYDIVLTRSPNDMVHIVGHKLKKHFGIRWVANWNDPADVIWPSEIPPYTPIRQKGIKKIINRRYVDSCINKSDISSFPAQTLLDHFKVYFPNLKSEKSIVIPHIGLSDTLFSPVKYEKKNQFRLCHAGNLVSNRNPELLFQVMRELIDEHNVSISLDIMGLMDAYMSDLVKKYRLEDNVHFIGSYPYIEVLNKMGDYDVLVLLEAKMHTGIYFASKIVDYAQVGRPIFALSPSTGFAKSTITQYGGGIVVNNEDFRDIKSGLLKLYEAWQTGELIERYNTQQLYSQFSSDRVVEIYNSIVKY